MATLQEQAAKLAARKIKSAEEAKKKFDRDRIVAKQQRELKAEMDRQVAWLLGTTIRDLMNEGKLTPQHLAALDQMLGMREDKPRNWNLLDAYRVAPIPRNPAERKPNSDEKAA